MDRETALEVLTITEQTAESKSVKEALAIAVQALKENMENKWIPCSKRLPRRKWVQYTLEDGTDCEEYESDPVLVRMEDNRIGVAVFWFDNSKDSDCWSGALFRDNEDESVDVKEWKKI